LVRRRGRRSAKHQERRVGDRACRPHTPRDPPIRAHRNARREPPRRAWSILEFANPGLLGPLEAFRKNFALPIERYSNDDAAARLRPLVGPFILRRLKSDPAIIQDLPAKNEMKVVCTLTREQASLYKAVVDEELRRIQSSEGIERRGRVLALLMFAKQICNHPAQYLGECGSSGHPRRGRLTRAPRTSSRRSCARRRRLRGASPWPSRGEAKDRAPVLKKPVPMKPAPKKRSASARAQGERQGPMKRAGPPSDTRASLHSSRWHSKSSQVLR
jgi:hypothetical protein